MEEAPAIGATSAGVAVSFNRRWRRKDVQKMKAMHDRIWPENEADQQSELETAATAEVATTTTSSRKEMLRTHRQMCFEASLVDAGLEARRSSAPPRSASPLPTGAPKPISSLLVRDRVDTGHDDLWPGSSAQTTTTTRIPRTRIYPSQSGE